MNLRYWTIPILVLLAGSSGAAAAPLGNIAVDGRVADLEGRAVAGARVEMWPAVSLYVEGVREADGLDAPPVATAVTGQDGRFTLTAPEAGMWTVTVRAAGFVAVRTALSPLLEAATLPDAVLARDAGLRVRVEDADGKPPPGARVRAAARKVLDVGMPSRWEPLPRGGVTGADGEARLARAADEALLVWAITAEPALAVRSDAHGDYRLEGSALAAGLQAAAPGFLPASRENVWNTANELPSLSLSPASFLAGTVVDETGRPVAGALVTVGTPRFNYVPGEETSRAWTSAAGSFRITGSCGQAACRVEVRHPDFASLAGTLDGLPREVIGLRLVLRRGATVTGMLVDEQGKPPAGSLEVELVRAPPDDGDVFRRATAGPDGRFVLSHLPAGHAALHVRRAGAAQFHRSGILIPETGTADLGRIVLPAGETLTVRVVDTNGRPLPGAMVSIQVEDPDYFSKGHTDPGFARSVLSTGANGEAVLRGLPPPGRKVSVAVCREGSMPERWGEEAVPKEPVEITLSPAVSLGGRVVDPEGAPVAGATVTALRNGAPLLLGHLDLPDEGPCFSGDDFTTDGEGRFTVSPLVPGWYRVTARRDDFLDNTVLAVEVPQGGRTGLSIPLAPREPPSTPQEQKVDLAASSPAPLAPPQRPAVRGWVADPALPAGSTVSGKIRGLKPAEIAWTEVIATMKFNDEAGIPGTLAADGSYRVGPLPPGPWILYTWACGRHERREIELRPDDREVTVDFEFGPLTPVSGRVTDADGAPRPHTDVYFYADKIGSFSAAARSDGTFEIRLEAGTYRTETRTQGYDVDEPPRELVAKGVPVTGLDVRLSASARLHGRIRGLQPGEVPWLNVEGAAIIHQIETDPDGTFDLTGLDQGTWKVSIDVIRLSGSLQTEEREVTVHPGDKDIVLDVTFPPEGAQP